VYNVRYHIASLAGVFLALALGLILGGLVVQRGTIDQQQGALVEGLRKEFSTLRESNTELTAENERLDAFATQLVGDSVEGTLRGKTVMIVTNAGREDGVSAATEAIESAGGTVAVAVILKPALGTADAKTRSGFTTATSAAEARSSVAASLVAEWLTSGSPRSLTATLTEAQVLRVEGLASGQAVSGLVDLATTDGQPDPAGIEIASAFGRLGPAVGAQTRTSGTGVAAAAHRAGVAGVDTIGTPLGSYSLVALLNGAKVGYYGVAEQALALYPEMPTR